MSFLGENLLDKAPEERAWQGVFLAFQYPVEIPGVSNLTFLKTAVNAVRAARGKDELDAINFLKFAREKDIAILLVTHNPELAKRCDHCIPMRDGLIV